MCFVIIVIYNYFLCVFFVQGHCGVHDGARGRHQDSCESEGASEQDQVRTDPAFSGGLGSEPSKPVRHT